LALMLASQDGDAKLGRGAAEAEDLVQEAVLAIHIQRHTFDPQEPLTPWLHAIARYKLINFLRRNRASAADAPIDQANDVMANDDHLSAEGSFDLRRLLKHLPEKMLQRSCGAYRDPRIHHYVPALPTPSDRNDAD
jgi:RNA polymerase sigma factor (sigma-70 family)